MVTRILSLAAALALGACRTGADAEAASTAIGFPPAPTATVIGAALALGACEETAGPQAVRIAMGFLPARTATVLGIDMEEFRSSKLHDRFGFLLRRRIASDAAFALIERACDIDIIGQMQLVLVGVGQDPRNAAEQYVVVTGLARDAWNTCYSKAKTKDDTITERGPVTGYGDGTRTAWLWWATPTTLVTSQEADGLEALAKDGARLPTNPTVMAQIERTDTSAMLWMAGAPPTDGTADAIFGSEDSPKNLSLALDVRGGLDAKIILELADEVASRKVDDHLEVWLQQGRLDPVVGDYFEAVEHDVSGSDVTISVSLDEKEVDHLIGMATMAIARRMSQ